MADTAISGLTAVTVTASTDEFAVNQAGASKKTTLEQIALFAQAQNFARIATARTLTSTTTAQAIFDSANDTLTLTTGVYFFDGLLRLSSMSATSGNFQFQILGAGTAVLNDVLYHAVGTDGATDTAATQTGSTSVTSSSAASIVTASTNTNAHVNLKGTFEVTSAGTIIPSIALVTASAAIVAAGSYLRFMRVADINATSLGAWA